MHATLKKAIAYTGVSAASALLLTAPAHAQVGGPFSNGNQALPIFAFNFNPRTARGTLDIASLANSVLRFILLIAGIVAVFVLIWNGWKYLTAGGDTKKTQEARQGIINAVIGIIIIMAAFLIVGFAVGLGSNIGNQVTNTEANQYTR